MTNQNEIASVYRLESARGATPAGLIVRLYDAIIEDLRQGLEAIAAKDIERRVGRINHILLIISELESVLDHKRGGEVAKRLRGFYTVTRAMIMEANFKASAEMMERIIGLYLPLRQAWQQAELDQRTGKAVPSNVPAPQPIATTPNPRQVAVGAGTEIEESTSQWSA